MCIAIVGKAGQGGTYVLRIRLAREVRLRFGGFKRGKEISMPAGEYAYVGSALAEKGGASLARRLVRHATRSGNRRPHAIRGEMVEYFGEVGLGAGDLLPGGKKKRWNVDFLLDLAETEIVGVVIARSPVRLEGRLARLLKEDPQTGVVERGLGAGDAVGETHLLRVEGGEAWWARLAERVAGLVDGG